MATSCQLPGRSITCPPWLQAALAEIEERVREAEVDAAAAAAAPDTFIQRAESYYRKRPQLISLLHDLHKSYIYLADRYSQAVGHRRQPTAAELEEAEVESSSDAESSLSFQQPVSCVTGVGELDVLVAELVTSTVEKEMLMLEMSQEEGLMSESTRKIEIQRSLLEVLESERVVLLGESARLGHRAQTAEEEAMKMAAEAAYMGRKAAELARVVVKMRGEHSACVLGRKIGGLQAQVYGLERMNRECFEAMAMGEKERGEAWAELERVRQENRRLREAEEARRRRRRRRWWWWGRFGRIDWVPCGPHFTGCKE